MFMSGAASVSRLQKLASPTFHTPPSSTDLPDCLLAIVWPAASMLYVTVALVVVIADTAVTVDETPCASGLLAKALIALVNLAPFCSSLTRSLAGVEEAKNFSQFALISAPAPVEVPVPDPPELADALAPVAAPDGVVDVTGICVPPAVLELLEMLEQAAAASTVTIAPTIARPLAGVNRIAAPPEIFWDGSVRCPATGIVFPRGHFLLSDDPRSPTLTSGRGFFA
jgi:hypothetical protein